MYDTASLVYLGLWLCHHDLVCMMLVLVYHEFAGLVCTIVGSDVGLLPCLALPIGVHVGG